MIREVIFWGDYFHSLYNQLDVKVKKKTDCVFWLLRYTEKVPMRFLKYLEDTDGLFEIKISTTFKEIRVLCFLMNQDWSLWSIDFLRNQGKRQRKKLNWVNG